MYKWARYYLNTFIKRIPLNITPKYITNTCKPFYRHISGIIHQQIHKFTIGQFDRWLNYKMGLHIMATLAKNRIERINSHLNSERIQDTRVSYGTCNPLTFHCNLHSNLYIQPNNSMITSEQFLDSIMVLQHSFTLCITLNPLLHLECVKNIRNMTLTTNWIN